MGYYNNIPQTGCLKQQTFLTVLEAGKSKIRVPVRPSSGEGLLPGPSDGGESTSGFSSSSYENTNPISSTCSSRPNLNLITFQILSHWEFQFQHKLEGTFHNSLLLAWMLQVSSHNLTFWGLNKTMTLMQSNALVFFIIIVCASMVLLGSLSPLQSQNLPYLFSNFIHLFACTGSSLLHGLSLIAVSRGQSSLQCGLLMWLLVAERRLQLHGHQQLEHEGSALVAPGLQRSEQLWCMGFNYISSHTVFWTWCMTEAYGTSSCDSHSEVGQLTVGTISDSSWHK